VVDAERDERRLGVLGRGQGRDQVEGLEDEAERAGSHASDIRFCRANSQ